MKEALENVEKKLMRMKTAEISEDSEEVKACRTFIAHGVKGMTPEQVKLLRTDSATDGGVFAVPEITTEVLKNLVEISPMRSIARVMTTNSKSVVLFKRTSKASGGWRGEREQAPKSSSKYGEVEIFVNKLMAETQITAEMLTDGIINLSNEIITDITEDFAEQEGFAFVKGDAVKKPQGFIENADVQVINSGAAADITADNVIDLAGELKTGYNAVYVLNRKTVAYLRKLQDMDGQYLWQAGMAGGTPNTLNGSPYIEMPDMDDVGADAKPLAFGDFARGYRIVDHSAMSMVRDDVTQARDDIINYIFKRRTGGQVVLPEAIKILQAKV
jgi:HK97 family phage major capsid protein